MPVLLSTWIENFTRSASPIDTRLLRSIPPVPFRPVGEAAGVVSRTAKSPEVVACVLFGSGRNPVEGVDHHLAQLLRVLAARFRPRFRVATGLLAYCQPTPYSTTSTSSFGSEMDSSTASPLPSILVLRQGSLACHGTLVILISSSLIFAAFVSQLPLTSSP